MWDAHIVPRNRATIYYYFILVAFNCHLSRSRIPWDSFPLRFDNRLASIYLCTHPSKQLFWKLIFMELVKNITRNTRFTNYVPVSHCEYYRYLRRIAFSRWIRGDFAIVIFISSIETLRPSDAKLDSYVCKSSTTPTSIFKCHAILCRIRIDRTWCNLLFLSFLFFTSSE